MTDHRCCEITPLCSRPWWKAILCVGIILLSGIADAKDCTVSREFRLKQPQELAGVLKDPNDVVLPGIRLELLSRGKIVKDLRTTSEGTYDFGVVQPGTYRIHIVRGDDPFCAPAVECGAHGCSIKPMLTPNPAKKVIVH